ncbi:7615_t:CDS:2, partial [Racocetra fulgida]
VRIISCRGIAIIGLGGVTIISHGGDGVITHGGSIISLGGGGDIGYSNRIFVYKSYVNRTSNIKYIEHQKFEKIIADVQIFMAC